MPQCFDMGEERAFGRGAIGFRKVKSQKSKNPPYEKRVGWAPSSVGDIRVVSADILVPLLQILFHLGMDRIADGASVGAGMLAGVEGNDGADWEGVFASLVGTNHRLLVV